MIVLDCQQGSEEWLEARRGIPTSSCFSKILTSKGTLSSQWDGYMNQLLAEYIDPTVSVEERVYTKAMQRGNELEPEARDFYSSITGNKVDEVGGLFLDEAKDSMCSPDGLVYAIKRGLEIKCPKLSTHVGYLRKNTCPDRYRMQVQSGMAFSGFQSWDFFSYHPSFKPFLLTVEIDVALVRTIKKTINHFIAELNKEKQAIDQNQFKDFT